MVVAAMKHMASNFVKLDKFEGIDFKIWQKKMHFLFSSISVVYVLTTPIFKNGENAIVDQIKKRAKWDNDDYVCRGLILNEHPSDTKVFAMKMEIMLEPTSNKLLLGTLPMLHPRSSEVKFIISSFQCQITVWGDSITIKTTLHEKLSINQECQDIRSNPSKDKELDIGGDQKLETSTLGEIVSLEKSNKNTKSEALINRNEDIGGSVVLEEVIEEVVVQQPEPELRKGNKIDVTP
nr:zinc finger, CCHC-type [Tanacetum cinerariifolium]